MTFHTTLVPGPELTLSLTEPSGEQVTCKWQVVEETFKEEYLKSSRLTLHLVTLATCEFVSSYVHVGSV